MIDLIADNVWPQLRPLLDVDAPRTAAIAYIGKGAAALLNLQSGDTLTFDGSNYNIANGSVDVIELRRLFNAGVKLHHLEGLHAKIIVLGEDPPRYVITGSANASTNSRDNLAEAVVVTDDDAVCAAAANQILAWKAAAGDPVDEAWITRAEAVPRLPQPGRRPRRRKASSSLASRAGQMHQISWQPSNSGITQLEVDAITAAEQANPAAVVDRIRLDVATWRAVREGDSLLLVRNSHPDRAPRPNAGVQEPVRVVAKVDRGHGAAKFVVYAARTHSPASTWKQVLTAISAADANSPADDGSLSAAARDAVFDYFAHLPDPAST